MPKRKRNSINTPFARTIIFSGVILLLVAFLLMRLETVSTWIGTILSTLRPVIIGAVITLVLHTPVRRLEGFLKNITKGKRFPCSAVAVILSYLLLFSVLAGIVCIIVPQFSQKLSGLRRPVHHLLYQLPEILANLQHQRATAL